MSRRSATTMSDVDREYCNLCSTLARNDRYIQEIAAASWVLVTRRLFVPWPAHNARANSNQAAPSQNFTNCWYEVVSNKTIATTRQFDVSVHCTLRQQRRLEATLSWQCLTCGYSTLFRAYLVFVYPWSPVRRLQDRVPSRLKANVLHTVDSCPVQQQN